MALKNIFNILVDLKIVRSINQPLVTQNDSVVFILEVMDNGVPFDLTDTTTISLAHTRKDGTVVVTPGTKVGNKATFVLGTNETAVAGGVIAKAQFYDASGRVSTLSFGYTVGADPTGADYVPSETEQTLIQVVMADAQAKIDELSAVDVVVLEQQLADIAYNMSPLKGNGVDDDSAAIQAIITSATSNKVKKIIFPKATYRINQPVYIRGNDIEIDFSGSFIKSSAKATAGVGAEIGIFNFRGEIVDGDIISYMRTIRTNPSPPVSAPQLLTYEAVKENSGLTTFVGGKITTSNNAYLNVGDDVLLRGWTQSNGIAYDKNLYQPELTVVAKVVKKDTTHVYIDYYSPFDYPAFVQSAQVKSVVIKCNMIKNVKIKNLEILDEATLASVNGMPTAQDKLEALCGISAILVDGVSFENVKVSQHRGNAIYPFYSRNIKMNNILADNPRLWDGGLGYLTQLIGCRDIRIENVTGNKCRHVVDFSWSSYAEVINAKGFESKSSDLDLHGICEHDITFKNSQGYLTIGNGIEYFPNMAKNITLENCNIEMFSLIGNAVFDDRFIDNVKIKGGKLKIRHLPMFLNTTIENVEIDWELNPFIASGVNKRSKTLNTKLEIINSKIIMSINNSAFDIYLSNVDETNIEGTTVSFKAGTSVSNTGHPIRNLGGAKLTIKKSVMEKIYVRFNNTVLAETNLEVTGSKFKYNSAETRFIFIDQLTNTLVKLNVSDNEVVHKGASAQFFALVAQNTNTVNSRIIGHFKDNTLLGNVNAKIHYIHSAQLDLAKLDTRIYDYNNIVEFKDPAGSNSLSTTRNFIIS